MKRPVAFIRIGRQLKLVVWDGPVTKFLLSIMTVVIAELIKRLINPDG